MPTYFERRYLPRYPLPSGREEIRELAKIYAESFKNVPPLQFPTLTTPAPATNPVPAGVGAVTGAIGNPNKIGAMIASKLLPLLNGTVNVSAAQDTSSSPAANTSAVLADDPLVRGEQIQEANTDALINYDPHPEYVGYALGVPLGLGAAAGLRWLTNYVNGGGTPVTGVEKAVADAMRPRTINPLFSAVGGSTTPSEVFYSQVGPDTPRPTAPTPTEAPSTRRLRVYDSLHDAQYANTAPRTPVTPLATNVQGVPPTKEPPIRISLDNGFMDTPTTQTENIAAANRIQSAIANDLNKGRVFTNTIIGDPLYTTFTTTTQPNGKFPKTYPPLGDIASSPYTLSDRVVRASTEPPIRVSLDNGFMDRSGAQTNFANWASKNKKLIADTIKVLGDKVPLATRDPELYNRIVQGVVNLGKLENTSNVSIGNQGSKILKNIGKSLKGAGKAAPISAALALILAALGTPEEAQAYVPEAQAYVPDNRNVQKIIRDGAIYSDPRLAAIRDADRPVQEAWNPVEAAVWGIPGLVFDATAGMADYVSAPRLLSILANDPEFAAAFLDSAQ